MNKEFVPYPEALKLSYIDFDLECFAWFDGREKDNPFEFVKPFNYNSYNNRIKSAPTFSQAFKWFRDKYNLDKEIYILHEHGVKFYHFLVLKLNKGNIEWLSSNKIHFNTYEDAELACLNNLIELVKE